MRKSARSGVGQHEGEECGREMRNCQDPEYLHRRWYGIAHNVGQGNSPVPPA